MNKRHLILAISALACLATSSCNTFIGMGRDVQRLGQGVENTAYKTAPQKNSEQSE
ncbi:entericidin A/B family lipoprotein [Persicirhabdus sediminis]|uniref:Entericidin A/B family lipoprotein n=1 Tax=Persicirhabdus sediminis TaxID=454144 RepID=A0A8J7SMZ6_9BACT|nr:entericidin A/B family lipoprotein [Persicirhabdus sediminis]MBK1792385.1 entericidin A/B family lipoprotein [Persicirhabdus sediminis]